MLNCDELLNLEEKILEALPDKLTTILIKLNSNGKLDEFLEVLDLGYLTSQNTYRPYRSGKIVVVGQTEVKESILLGVAESCGVSKDRFEFCLDYNKAKSYNFKKMQYEPKYSLVLFDPIPHSGVGKEDYGSIITTIQNTEGYPPVITMGSNTLKISKSGFKSTLLKVLDDGIIS